MGKPQSLEARIKSHKRRDASQRVGPSREEDQDDRKEKAPGPGTARGRPDRWRMMAVVPYTLKDFLFLADKAKGVLP